MSLRLPPQNVPPLIMTADSAEGVNAGDLDRNRLWNKDWWLFLQQLADAVGGSTPTPPTPPVVGVVLSVDLKLTADTDLNGTVPGVAHGDLLVVRLEQDSTGGWAVTWPAYMTHVPTLPTTASTVSLMCFVGTAIGTWDLCGAPVLGVTPTSAPTTPPHSPGRVQVVDILVTAPTLIPVFISVLGNVRIVRILQDSTGGWPVSFTSAFRYAPVIPTEANTSSILIFFGAVTGKWELCALPVLGRIATSGSLVTTDDHVEVLEVTASADISVTAPVFAGPPLLIVRITQDNIGGWAVSMGSGFSPLPVWTGDANQTRSIMFYAASSGKWETCAQLV